MWAMTRERRRGFTLLEVMIAMAVLAISLTAVLRLQGMSASLAGRTRFETVAPLLAQKKMSEFMALEQDALTPDRGDFGDQYPDFAWRLAVETVTAPENLDGLANRIKRLDLEVTFREDVYSYELRAYRLVDKES